MRPVAKAMPHATTTRVRQPHNACHLTAANLKQPDVLGRTSPFVHVLPGQRLRPPTRAIDLIGVWICPARVSGWAPCWGAVHALAGFDTPCGVWGVLVYSVADVCWICVVLTTVW